MKRLIKACVLCLAFSLVMLTAVSAATPKEMYENGVVSDDGIRLGDARDGEITDVSEGGEIFTGEGTGMLDDMINGSDNGTAPDKTSTPDKTNAPVTTDNTSGNTTGNDSGNNSGSTADDGEGTGLGVIVAVIVVIAVVVIIFLLLPKRR